MFDALLLPRRTFWSRARRWLIVALAPWLSGLPPVCAQTAPSTGPESARPRVALVLSGGGARGLAHIGVLKVLRDLKVPVDIVVGTSMGSVIGGAYAAGRSIDDLEAIVRATAWDDVLSDRSTREQSSWRRREEDLILPSRLDFALGRKGLSLPPSAAANFALEEALARLLPAHRREQSAGSLALPFRSLAADLLTGDLVELDTAPLMQALRASLSVPGVFEPVRVQGRLLVDGGLVRNLPVDIARAMGAQVVIAVNVGTPLAPEESLRTSLDVAQQMLTLLTEQNVQRSLSELGPSDVLMSPDLKGIGVVDFGQYDRIIRAGAEAARQVAARLALLAVAPPAYADLEAQRLAPAGPPDRAWPLGSIKVQGAQRIDARTLVAQSGLEAGRPATLEDVRAAAARLHGRGDLARVEAVVTDATSDDGPGLRRDVSLRVTEADWAHSRLRLGLELRSDFSDDNAFGVSAMHVASSLNAWGAELRTLVGVGTQRGLSTEWWQPLGAGSPWYASASLGYSAGSRDLFAERRRQLRLGYKALWSSWGLGYRLGEWGDLQLSRTQAAYRVRSLIPEDPSSSLSFSTSSLSLDLTVDTLDPIAFPVRGVLLSAQWSRTKAQSIETRLPSQSQSAAMRAFSQGEWGGHVYGEWARTRGAAAPLALGGFLRLSGTDPESIEGNTVVLGRLVLARRIGSLPVPFGNAIRAGFSFELGNGFTDGQAIRLTDLKGAGSAFLALDTRFGPLYLGAGATGGRLGTFYIYLGPFWRR